MSLPIWCNLLGVKCYCEYENGGYAKNGIICKNRQGDVNATSCEIGEGCTGATNETNAVRDPKFLCEKGTTNIKFCHKFNNVIKVS